MADIVPYTWRKGMPNTLNFRRDGYSDEDRLGFDKYIDTLSSMIRDSDFETPFCIGIYGKWGSGKTSFMRLLEKELVEKGESEPYPVTVWFNPWRYEKEEHLIIPFLKTIEQALEQYKGKQELLKPLKGMAKKIGEAAAAFAYGLKAEFKLLGIFGFTFDAAKAVEREEEDLVDARDEHRLGVGVAGARGRLGHEVCGSGSVARVLGGRGNFEGPGGK